ncbi:MAG: hypothetical protein AB7G48_04985 [Nitrospiraceae bacterium]
MTLGFGDRTLAAPTGISRADGESVPEEEYPVYDRIVESKFLTSLIQIVVIERFTLTRLHPNEPDPPSEQWFEEQQPFDGRLPHDLIADFIAKNQRPARLQPQFRFGARVRFVTPEGAEESDVFLGPQFATWRHSVQADDTRLDRLAFSRVAWTLKEDQALVYVANERPDGTGAGFLYWLQRQGQGWNLFDTDIVWVAHPEERRS